MMSPQLLAVGCLAAFAVATSAAGCTDTRETAEPTEATTTTSVTARSLLARCGARGAPVTLAKLVSVFRANGVTLDIDRRGCERPAYDPHLPGATNAGPSGLEPLPGVYRREGHVLCDVARVPHASNREVETVKYPTDEETQVGVLNVGCSVYPSDEESEATQIALVQAALEAVERDTPR